jgi:hypothetical protein
VTFESTFFSFLIQAITRIVLRMLINLLSKISRVFPGDIENIYSQRRNLVFSFSSFTLIAINVRRRSLINVDMSLYILHILIKVKKAGGHTLTMNLLIILINLSVIICKTTIGVIIVKSLVVRVVV